MVVGLSQLDCVSFKSDLGVKGRPVVTPLVYDQSVRIVVVGGGREGNGAMVFRVWKWPCPGSQVDFFMAIFEISRFFGGGKMIIELVI